MICIADLVESCKDERICLAVVLVTPTEVRLVDHVCLLTRYRPGDLISQ